MANPQELDRIVVPMPAFADPNDPAKAAGSVNLTLDKHPAEHSEDYGAELDKAVTDVPVDTQDVSSEAIDPSTFEDTVGPQAEDHPALAAMDADESVGAWDVQDYDEMSNKELQAKAKARGLSGYSTLNHDDLVKLLKKSDKGDEQNTSG